MKRLKTIGSLPESRVAAMVRFAILISGVVGCDRAEHLQETSSSPPRSTTRSIDSTTEQWDYDGAGNSVADWRCWMGPEIKSDLPHESDSETSPRLLPTDD